ncbi:MAG TPA: hypothetical protein VHV30_14680, partial [Polyangiaceae bacterium]|nr:hypothetical protein [Polyangiaceae bacterium]
VVGLAPFATVLLVRSAWARGWAASETQRLLKEQGIVASYAPSLRVWPLAVVLDGVRVESTDGGAPVVECDRVALRPRLFALLAGKLAIDQIDLDAPRIRAVVRDGKIQNLAVKSQESGPKSQGPIHAPFNTFSVTDGAIALDLGLDPAPDPGQPSRGVASGEAGDAREKVVLAVQSIDLDVTADDDPDLGSSFETALRVGRATVARTRITEPGKDGAKTAIDEDALCSIEGRVRVEPDSLLIRRFQAVGSADLDAAPGTAPACDLPATDKRRVEVAIGHLHVVLPKADQPVPAIDGHVHLRAPIALAGRAVSLPDTDGWVGVDADVRYGPGGVLPDLNGTIEAHDIRLDQYAFAHDVTSEIAIHGSVIESPKTTVRFAGGTIVLSETVIEPLTQGGLLRHTRLDATGVDFTTLLRDLGIHESSWVGWEIRELHAPSISGTFAPLKIDGDFTAKTYGFGVYDRPAEDRSRERLFGFSEAQLVSHFAIRPEALKFIDVRAVLPHSRIDGGLCSIGFDNQLRVDVPHLEADLDDVSPIGPVAMRGKLVASAHIDGVFNNPRPVADITSLTGFNVADLAFGDLSSGHVEVDVRKPEIAITGVHARRRESAYDVPTAKLRFGGGGGFVVDAVASSGGFGLRDVLSIFALDEDPRFDGLDANLATRADVHVSLGGPEDACGGGFVSLGAKGHLRDVSLYGEKFAQGDADVSFRWYDRQRGIAGADLDMRSFVLEKVAPAAGAKSAVGGSILGSATIRRGGALAGNVLIENLPVARIDAFGPRVAGVGGSVSGVARVTGNLDDFQPDAGFVARAGLDVTPIRVGEVALQGSHLDVTMTNRMTQEKHAVGKTRCGAPIGTPFDAKAYRADTASHGEWTVNGDLFGQTVHLRDLVMTRARSAHVSGRASMRGVDLGAVIGISSPAKTDSEDLPQPADGAIAGQLWGELIIDDLPLDEPSRARGRVLLGPTFASRGADRVTLRPPREPIELANDTLTLPPLEVLLEAGGGGPSSTFHGGFVVSGGVTKATTDPTLAFDARLEPIDLAVLPRIVPKVDGASGKLEGGFKITGKLAAPTVAGELTMKADDLEIHNVPGSITNVRIALRASSSELAAAGTGEFGGGTIAFDGSIPIRGFAVGALDSRITVRGVHYNRTDGIKALVDADLRAAYDPKSQVGTSGAIPRLTGDVTIDSFDYTR